MRYDAHTRRNPAQLNWLLRPVEMIATPTQTEGTKARDGTLPIPAVTPILNS